MTLEIEKLPKLDSVKHSSKRAKSNRLRPKQLSSKTSFLSYQVKETSQRKTHELRISLRCGSSLSARGSNFAPPFFSFA